MMNNMHLIIMRFDHMTSENNCNVKDDLVNQLIALNNKLNTLNPNWLHSEQARFGSAGTSREPLRRNQEASSEETRRHSLSCRPAPIFTTLPFLRCGSSQAIKNTSGSLASTLMTT